MTERHEFHYNGSSASGKDTYYKCTKCGAEQTAPEPHSLDKNQHLGCNGISVNKKEMILAKTKGIYRSIGRNSATYTVIVIEDTDPASETVLVRFENGNGLPVKVHMNLCIF